ncbi:MAG: inositol monophosphatase [Rhodothermales bacterium]|nr:inositol monophosphatase [Rhodothermales bacterium]
MQHTLIADAAEAAARAAGAVLRDFARDRARLVLRDKGLNELVSEADVAAQRTLVLHLDGVVPGATFLGEEEGLGVEPEAGAAAPSGLRWVLDPLDGTTNFTRGVPPYAVSVGLVDGASPVLGVVYELVADELFRAAPGEGLTLNGAPASVSATDDLPDTLLATGFPYRRFHYQEAYLAVLGSLFGRSRGVRRHGAASVDLAYVAVGRFDGFFEAGLSPWDVAAGLALVQHGGGRATDFAGAANPLYAGQAVATNGRIHHALLDAVAPLVGVRG